MSHSQQSKATMCTATTVQQALHTKDEDRLYQDVEKDDDHLQRLHTQYDTVIRVDDTTSDTAISRTRDYHQLLCYACAESSSTTATTYD
eukprot:1354270-Amphidinium_carterae.1